MSSSVKTPFAAYIDFTAQLEPQLLLVGGVYNFEIEKNDVILLNDIAAQKPHIGCMVKENGVPYLFLLLRLSEPLASFESCEVKIQKPAHTICWRMLGSRLFTTEQKPQAQEAIQTFSDKTQLELVAMQTQYNQRFQMDSALEFFPVTEIV